MSSLSNLPYGKILDYWYEKLAGKSYRFKFIITKIFEVYTFKSVNKKCYKNQNYLDFPEPVKNTISGNPKLSIVIPVFLRTEKENQNVINLLESIEKQSLLPYEIIMIDDSSPIILPLPPNVKVFRLDSNSGPAKARNIGKNIALENGSDIIAFTDIDCILSKDWVSTIINSFINYKDAQILSGNTPSYNENWFGTYHNINGTLNGRQLKNSEALLYGTTANLAITRRVAEKIDFNEKFPIAAGEDIEFCFRANNLGFSIKHVPTMVVHHNYGYTGQLPNDLKRFRNQFRKYGLGEKILIREIPNYYAYFDRTVEIPVMCS